ncbi:hypothetical protein FB645_003722 [Coemansia sp. IMI 203386]|nr:hypothetical protein FB645_003722 [Coemansia sp. IMI 203386]
MYTDTPSLSNNHPYYPQSLVLPGYVEPTHTSAHLLASMTLMIGLPLLALHIAAKHHRPHLSLTDRFIFLWFVLCGSLHCLFELHYLRNFHTLASNTDFASSLWKEYAKSDSRYLAQSPLVYVLESITVFVVGPLSLFTAWCIWQQQQNDSSAARFLGQMAVSLMHLYSALVYFGSEFLAKQSNCRPEPVYYVGYLISMNLPWIIVPIWLIVQSFGVIAHAMKNAKRHGRKD